MTIKYITRLFINSSVFSIQNVGEAKITNRFSFIELQSIKKISSLRLRWTNMSSNGAKMVGSPLLAPSGSSCKVQDSNLSDPLGCNQVYVYSRTQKIH